MNSALKFRADCQHRAPALESCCKRNDFFNILCGAGRFGFCLIDIFTTPFQRAGSGEESK